MFKVTMFIFSGFKMKIKLNSLICNIYYSIIRRMERVLRKSYDLRSGTLN